MHEVLVRKIALRAGDVAPRYEKLLFDRTVLETEDTTALGAMKFKQGVDQFVMGQFGILATDGGYSPGAGRHLISAYSGLG
jgi:hypothetical protein